MKRVARIWHALNLGTYKIEIQEFGLACFYCLLKTRIFKKKHWIVFLNKKLLASVAYY